MSLVMHASSMNREHLTLRSICFGLEVQFMLEDVSHAVGWFAMITVSLLLVRTQTRLRRVEMHAAALEEHVSWYKRALHMAGIGVWEWNMRDDEWRWSERMYEIMGFPSSEAPPKNEAYYKRIPEADRHITYAREGECVGGRQSLRNEYRFDTPDRGIRWVRDAGDAVLDDEGKPTHMLGVTIDITDEKASLGLLERRASTDELTGIPNRAALLHYMQQAVVTSSAERNIAVTFIDLNGFKAVNDNLGHEAGDDLLRRVATALRAALPPETFVARFGGDEFVCVCWTSPTETRSDLKAMEQTLERVFTSIMVDGLDMTVGAAVGMTVSGNGSTAGSLIKDADGAMYEAKATGRWFAMRTATVPDQDN
ncbi:sensor domain-containing diguanylate cyclase [Aureimonas sp. AU20]|uniref:sensor domain-containing diguanylate cyclase n=2 Tax=Aureimonas sp. AU20 TaxID=1349819 RepID=UPI00178CFF9E|nr:sensor domain-containing diguanylate cyclase [Aureimonas sp. AU20]